MKKILSILLFVFAVAPIASAQTSKGTISGVVRDVSGAAVPNADVTATNVETSETRTVKSGETGSFRFDAVTPGKYTLSTSATGFQKFDATDLQVRASLVTSYDPTLSVGIVNDTVTVVAGGATLDTENGSLAGTINSEELAKVPIFTLNPIELATTVPGVQIVSNSGFSNGENIQVSGSRPRSNNFLIDGQDINDLSIAGQAFQPAIPFLYRETTVYTHNPPAEFGRASGGVVNLVTQGGTNTFHGSVWELYSGSGLNSLDGQTRQTENATKTRINEHQIGFVAGGPIWKDKLFAFGGGQWSRIYGKETAPYVIVPDAAGVALLRTIAAGSNPTTSANAKLMLQYLRNADYLTAFEHKDLSVPYETRSLGAACPSAPGSCAITTNQYRRPAPNQSNPDTQWSYRVDFNPRASDSFYGRYLHDRSSLTPDLFANSTAQPGFDTLQGGPSEVGQVGWTHIFTPRLLNEFRVAETRIAFAFAPTAESLANPLYTAPRLSFSGTGGITALGFAGASFPQGRALENYQFQDTVSWTRGRHTIRVGGDIGRQISQVTLGINTPGTITFSATGSGGGSVGNFLLNQLGASGTATRTFGNRRFDPHSWKLAGFFQDDIKLTSDLVVNVGARYDYNTAPENSLAFPAISLNDLYGAINTYHPVKADKNNLAPRVGFAYSPHGGKFLFDGKSVLRGGFGVFFDTDFSNIAINSASAAPNAVSGTLTSTATNGLPNALALIPQISPNLLPTSTVTSVLDSMRSPYTYQWNLGIERQLPGDILVSATYVGNRGLKLYGSSQFNYFNPGTAVRLNTSRGIINARGNFADSMYHGLETFAEHKFRHGILVRGTYTYSKMLDSGSEVFALDGDVTAYPADLSGGGRRQEWGNSSYDHRHYASILYVWSPRGFHSSNAFSNLALGALTRDWTISGTSQFQSGAYTSYNVSGFDLNGDGTVGNDRPIIGNISAPINSAGVDGKFVGGTPGVYYDQAVYNTQVDGAGNSVLQPVSANNVHFLIQNGQQFLSREVGRNSFLNPGQMFNNVAAEKGFQVGRGHFENVRLVLRIEAQNVANHNNVGVVDTDISNIGSTSFMNKSNARTSGTADGGQRSVRLWGRVTF